MTSCEDAAPKEQPSISSSGCESARLVRDWERFGPAMAAKDAVVTLVVHYKPRPSEGEPFKLKLKVPSTKTVEAAMKAFAKAVAKSDRGYGLVIDPADCYAKRIDAPPPEPTGHAPVDDAALERWEDAQAYVRPETTVGKVFPDGRGALRLVRRDDVPEKDVDDTNWGAPRELSFWTITTKG